MTCTKFPAVLIVDTKRTRSQIFSFLALISPNTTTCYEKALFQVSAKALKGITQYEIQSLQKQIIAIAPLIFILLFMIMRWQ